MSKSPNRLLRVFLCHSSNDKHRVRELYHRLNTEGWIDVWLDEEKLYPGQDWKFEIEQAVKTSDVIIVCLSKESVTKEGYVQRELRIVLDVADYKPEGTLFVIPVRLEDCKLPLRLASWQYADYFQNDQRDNSYARLLMSLRIRAEGLGISIDNPSRANVDQETDEHIRRNAPKGQEKEVMASLSILDKDSNEKDLKIGKKIVHVIDHRVDAQGSPSAKIGEGFQDDELMSKNNIHQPLNLNEFPSTSRLERRIQIISMIFVILLIIASIVFLALRDWQKNQLEISLNDLILCEIGAEVCVENINIDNNPLIINHHLSIIKDTFYFINPL